MRDPWGFEGSCKTFVGMMVPEGFHKDHKVIERSERIQEEFDCFRTALMDL